MVLSHPLNPHDAAPDDKATFALGRKQPLPTQEAVGPELRSTDNDVSSTRTEELLDDHADSIIGRVIGNYLIEEVVGECGMGTVFRAEQLRPVRRTVALKMVRSELAGSEAVRRFLSERQALAMMDHPEIAHVLDAGTMPDGNPFFVMEFADGVPLDHYCDEHRMSVRHRVELMVRVCRAIQHAHQKGVIHRDIKPSNILIGDEQSVPAVKVIDFGIAKSLENSFEADKQTQVGQVIGTPQYMSPEQARFSEIDGRSDVFALGAVLHALLTGQPPLPMADTDPDSLPAVLQQIAEIDPEHPSRTVRRLPWERLAELAANRDTATSRLKRDLKGDLDWIVLRALAPDRSDRYATAGDLADDLERYLADQPVRAVAPKLSYRLRKFVRRQRTTVMVVSAVCVTLVASAAIGGVVRWQEMIEAERKLGELTSEITEHLADVRVTRAHAHQDRSLWNGYLTRADNRLGKAESLLGQTAGLDGLRQELRDLRCQYADDEQTASLMDSLNAARDRGAGVSPMDGIHDKQMGLQAMRETLSRLGVSVGETSPQQSVQYLRRVPRAFHDEIIESLDFCLNEDLIGVGLECESVEDSLYVGVVVPDSPAVASNRIQRGDRLLSLQIGDRKEDVSKLSPAEAQQRFANEPGSIIMLQLASDLTGEYEVQLECAGNEAYWAAAVLAELDPHPWRTRLRTAIIEADFVNLRAMAGADDLEQQSPFSLIQLAQKLPEPERSTIGIDILYLARQKYPDSYWTNQYLGLGLLLDAKRTNANEASRFFTAATSINPHSKNAFSSLANALLMTRQFSPAVAALYRVVELDPEHRHLRFQLARVLHHLGRLHEAVDQYKELLQRDAADSNVMGYLGEIYEMQGRTAKQVELYRQALQYEPDNVSTGYRLVSALRNSGREAEAKALNESMLSRAPDIDGFALIYSFYEPQNRPPYAPAEVRDQFADSPKPAIAHKLHGYVLWQITEPPAAISAFQESLRLAPNDAETHFFLGEAYHLIHDSKSAEASYRAALKIRSDYASARRKLEELTATAN